MRLKEQFRTQLLGDEKLIRKILNDVEYFNGKYMRLYTFLTWLKNNDERLTCYSILLSISQHVEMPVEALLELED